MNTGTTGLLPLCKLCDECSTRWVEPINDLETSVSREIDRAQSLTVTNVTHTEIREGRDLVKPLLDLIADVERFLNSSTIDILLQNVLETHSNITDVILVIKNLIVRAKTVEGLLETANATLTIQKIQLLTIKQQLESLCTLLMNLTKEINEITLTDFSTYADRIQSAVSSSNQSSDTVQYTVLPSLEESQEKLSEFTEKQAHFTNASRDIVQLLTVLRMKLRNYQNLVIKADQTLCGKDIDTFVDSLQCGCYGNRERCDSQCGGIGCVRCGGECNGTISEIKKTVELSAKALREATRLQDLLQSDIRQLHQANDTSSEANSLAATGYRVAEREKRNISEIFALIQSFTGDVTGILTAKLLNTSLIEDLTEETLSLQLSKTPEEVS